MACTGPEAGPEQGPQDVDTRPAPSGFSCYLVVEERLGNRVTMCRLNTEISDELCFETLCPFEGGGHKHTVWCTTVW